MRRDDDWAGGSGERALIRREEKADGRRRELRRPEHPKARVAPGEDPAELTLLCW